MKSRFKEGTEQNFTRLAAILFEKMSRNISLYKKRQAIVEHPFGTIKRQRHMTHTLLKGKEKVNGEFALIFLGYNFSRIMTMIKDKVLKINEIMNLWSNFKISSVTKRYAMKMEKMKKMHENDQFQIFAA